MANSLTHTLPYPIRNARFSLPIAFRTSAGVLTDPTTPDTEKSTDGGATFSDTAEEITTGGSNGAGYITLTGAEMDNPLLILAAKSANDLTTLVTLLPRVLAVVGSGTLSAGSAGGGTLGTILAYDVTGCFIRTTGGTGGGGTGGENNQARKIVTYTPSTGAFTVSPNWETTPDNTTTYDILLPEGVTLGMLRTLNPTTPGRTLDVSSGGEAGLDWANVGNPTTTLNLSGTTVKAVTDRVTANTDQIEGVDASTYIESRTLAAAAYATAAGQVTHDLNIAALDTNLELLLSRLTPMSGTIGSTGNTTTTLHLSGLTGTDDFYNDMLIGVMDASNGNAIAMRWITDWANTGDLATLDEALPFTPQASVDGYVVYPIRRVVQVSGFTTAGKAEVQTEVEEGAAVALNTAVPGSPTAGSINERVKTMDDADMPAILATVAGDVAGLDGAAMRGTDGAYTGTPPTASQNADAVWAHATAVAFLAKFTGISKLAAWLKRAFRKDVGDADMATAETEINTGGTSTYVGTTDNLQAIKDASGGGAGGSLEGNWRFETDRGTKDVQITSLD